MALRPKWQSKIAIENQIKKTRLSQVEEFKKHAHYILVWVTRPAYKLFSWIESIWYSEGMEVSIVTYYGRGSWQEGLVAFSQLLVPKDNIRPIIYK